MITHTFAALWAPKIVCSFWVVYFQSSDSFFTYMCWLVISWRSCRNLLRTFRVFSLGDSLFLYSALYSASDSLYFQLCLINPSSLQGSDWVPFLVLKPGNYLQAVIGSITGLMSSKLSPCSLKSVLCCLMFSPWKSLLHIFQLFQEEGKHGLHTPPWLKVKFLYNGLKKHIFCTYLDLSNFSLIFLVFFSYFNLHSALFSIIKRYLILIISHHN